MYNDKRAASVVAATPATVWALDRATFRYYIVSSNMAKEDAQVQYQEPHRSDHRSGNINGIAAENRSRYEDENRGGSRPPRPSQNPNARARPNKKDWRDRRNKQMERRHSRRNQVAVKEHSSSQLDQHNLNEHNLNQHNNLNDPDAQLRSVLVGGGSGRQGRGSQRNGQRGQFAPSIAPSQVHSQAQSVVSNVFANAISRGSRANKNKMPQLQYPLQPQDWKALYKEIRSRDKKKTGLVHKATIVDVMSSAGLPIEQWQVDSQLGLHSETKGGVRYHDFIKSCIDEDPCVQ